MRGRDFLLVAQQFIRGGTEAHWRSAAGRTYYALLIESRDLLQRWGFNLPPRDKVHASVRLRFTYAADPDMKDVGLALDLLSQLRNQADYDMGSPRFVTVRDAQLAVVRA